MELLRSVAVEGDRAVIIVTHDSRVFEFADCMATMEDGHIIGVERPGDPRRGKPAHDGTTAAFAPAAVAAPTSNSLPADTPGD
jgi:ABC-type multidrug transport system ATPase subunit